LNDPEFFSGLFSRCFFSAPGVAGPFSARHKLIECGFSASNPSAGVEVYGVCFLVFDWLQGTSLFAPPWIYALSPPGFPVGVQSEACLRYPNILSYSPPRFLKVKLPRYPPNDVRPYPSSPGTPLSIQLPASATCL